MVTTQTKIAGVTLPTDLEELLGRCKGYQVAYSVKELADLACGGPENDSMDVTFDLPDGKQICEARVARVRNGIAANYDDTYMRRRDPNSMVIADDKPTDKKRYEERFGESFDRVRGETFDWLASQELALFFFSTGRGNMGQQAVAVVPSNCGFFALGLALLQGIKTEADVSTGYAPSAVIYVAPPMRHTHFEGKQVVVHNRGDELYELFSYNLYPGPSAKKGVYGMLIGLGEAQGWVTAHCSTVQVVTPYDNVTTIMHEGASGGGKSEMLQQAHRMPDGRLMMGHNVITKEERFLEIPRTCELLPVTDDMALCHPKIQEDDGRLWVTDAENGWFVRVDHITDYGTDMDLERLTANPPEPLLFLNIDAVPNSRAMIWEHIMDTPEKPCPNPRVVLPRSIVPKVVSDSVGVDVRSLGVRVPPCTRENPSYGIMGYMHVLPPALAWLWRLVAPRGHANPSITDTGGMSSEGVGSYWPFATGLRVAQANLLLEQIVQTPKTQYLLIPNQHVGAWETGFMPEWVARDYIARRGSAKFKDDQIVPARCPLLGYALYSMRVEGMSIPRWFLEVNTQPEVGDWGYDAGARELFEFFEKTLKAFMVEGLSPLGKKIIETCLAGGSVEEYERLMQDVDSI